MPQGVADGLTRFISVPMLTPSITVTRFAPASRASLTIVEMTRRSTEMGGG